VNARSGPAGPHPTEAWNVGLYSLTDAVQYSGIPMSTVARWLEPRPQGTRDDLVTFDEFVTLLFVRQLRKRGVRLKEIREAERDLQERTSHRHPFVHETLWVAGRDVMVRVTDAADAFLSANRRGQLAIPGVLEAQRVDLPSAVADVRGQLGYDEGRVAVWRPVERISARPAVQYGLTCVDGTRLTTRTIYDVAEAGDEPVRIARLFEVTETDVAQAIEWERQLAA
jgi:uncharacterized protein (DUF433 family)